ncbi:MAG TPA: VWA domain-containing protein [Vicinamibacterales bacterium]
MRGSFVCAAVIVAVIAGCEVGAQQPPRFGDRVDVVRIIIDARVLDEHGNPMTGLTAGDFNVNIDGKSARVETATWIGGRDTDRDAVPPESTPLPDAGAPIGPGRLIVFLFQKDLEPSRIVGLMRMLQKNRNFLETLTPNDRVAILSFDSHLKIWTDFTNDRERLDRVLAHGVLFERPPPVQAASTPSLVERLDAGRGRKTYTIERALELIGDALEPLPGSKSLILIGHGFGRFSSSGVTMERAYGPARHALVASRTSVFSLDVTNADYHSLEAGLQLVSEETGGFYARTHIFPDFAMQRLSGAIAGYYVLFVEKPDSRRATYDIEVELTRRKGQVLATRTYSEN